MPSNGQFEVYKTGSGAFRWRLTGPGGKVVATSAESFASGPLARRAAVNAKARAEKAEVAPLAAAAPAAPTKKPAAAAKKPAAKKPAAKAAPKRAAAKKPAARKRAA